MHINRKTTGAQLRIFRFLWLYGIALPLMITAIIMAGALMAGAITGLQEAVK